MGVFAATILLVVRFLHLFCAALLLHCPLMRGLCAFGFVCSRCAFAQAKSSEHGPHTAHCLYTTCTLLHNAGANVLHQHTEAARCLRRTASQSPRGVTASRAVFRLVIVPHQFVVRVYALGLVLSSILRLAGTIPPREDCSGTGTWNLFIVIEPIYMLSTMVLFLQTMQYWTYCLCRPQCVSGVC